MSDDEYSTIQELSTCKFLPGSWQKRFVRKLAAQPRDYALSTKQREIVWRIAASWGKQLGWSARQRIPVAYRAGLQGRGANG